MAFFEDFKKFAFKGNVIDLSVGVVIGQAFGKIVSALVADIVMPIIGLILPTGDWRNAGLVIHHAAEPKDNVILKWGDFLGAVFDFFVIAIALFLILSRIIQAAEKRFVGPKETPPATKECPFCLEMIPAKATRCRACTSELKAA